MRVQDDPLDVSNVGVELQRTVHQALALAHFGNVVAVEVVEEVQLEDLFGLFDVDVEIEFEQFGLHVRVFRFVLLQRRDQERGALGNQVLGHLVLGRVLDVDFRRFEVGTLLPCQGSGQFQRLLRVAVYRHDHDFIPLDFCVVCTFRDFDQPRPILLNDQGFDYFPDVA